VTHGLPARVISWYGDDFTGSTDVLEVLAPHMPAVLFLRRPDDRAFAQFSEYAAFGLAGSSRSEHPEWMEIHLAGAFEWLASLGSAVCHYKVCSTFDSSPQTGNIGRAAEIGKRVFDARFVPIVVGAPALGRYTVFGNLFAAAGDTVYRIDRHPTMRCHPVTPMREADLRVHLKEQTDLSIGLLDMLGLKSPDACERFRDINRKSDAVLIDVIDEATLAAAGRLLWQVDRQPFLVGSSGVEYALIRHWHEEQLIANSVVPSPPEPTDRLLVLSGSCSPITQQQIVYAGRNGFNLIRLDVHELTAGERSSTAAEEVSRAALEALSEGRSAILFTAASPQDRVDTFNSAADQLRFRHTLSERAGQILSRVADASGVKRVVVAGGDTSSHSGRQLGLDALTFVAHLAPGAPLCRAWSQTTNRQGLEIVFKGGQCGSENFFEVVLNGRN
jgi:3-oxoisoapionate kinase